MKKRFLLSVTLALALAAILALPTHARAVTPFGGDDTGFVPSGGTKTGACKCEVGASKAFVKYLACVQKCHDTEASGKLAGDVAEDTCENNGSSGKNGCLVKFNKTVSKLKGCPPCLNPTALATSGESYLDSNNGAIYCSSPSGAFLDGPMNF